MTQRTDHGDFRELRLDRINRTFGSHHALRDMSLTIQVGEFVALLGPSGCGKTTALNCLAGLLPLSSGAIWLDDRRIDVLPSEKRGFGMVFQSYALFPHMSVRKNIGFGLAMRGVAKREIAERVDRAIRMVQLGQHADKLPGQLSGGQQQRVAIARAIVIEPPLVLMDEPLSNLDAKLRLEMRAEIRRIHASVGRATVYVTHDQEEALSLADRIVVMKDGLVRQVGTPEDLYHRPANLDVARFMGFRNELAGEAEGNVIRHRDVALQGVRRDAGATRQAVAVFRPEDLEPVAAGANGIPVTVTAVEYGGREFHLTGVTAGGVELLARSRERVVVGDRLTLGVAPEQVLLFDAGGDAAPRGFAAAAE
ncbi:MAG: ABC transporter ATP-binding protein [Ferrovibrionaceae bacterium]